MKSHQEGVTSKVNLRNPLQVRKHTSEGRRHGGRKGGISDPTKRTCVLQKCVHCVMDTVVPEWNVFS